MNNRLKQKETEKAGQSSSHSSGGDVGPRVSLWQGTAYSLPFIVTTYMSTPVATALPGIYAKYFGLALPVIATIMFIGRMFDAVTDPIVGYLSDTYQAKTGTRKPFIVAGALLFLVCAYFLYVPPENVTAAYFLGWSLLFYLSWTAFEIPHITWGGELSRDSTEKTKVYSMRTGAGFVGLLLFYAMPLLPFFETTEITPETLRWSVFAGALFMLPFLYLCVTNVPTGHNFVVAVQPANPQRAGKTQRVRLLCKAFFQNKPLLIFLAGYICFGIGIGMWYGLIFIYVDSYLGLGELFAGAFMLSFAISIPLIPVWYKVAGWLGKKYSWALAGIFFTIACIYTVTLDPDNTDFAKLVMLKVITDLGFTCVGILAPSMLSDIVDYSTWKFGVNRDATYFSIYVFFTKTAAALGAAFGLAVAGFYGFDPAATTFTEEAVFGLELAIAWIPALFMLCSLVFILLTPITERRHQIIRRRLASRKKVAGYQRTEQHVSA